MRAAKSHGWQSLVQYFVRAVDALRLTCSEALHAVLRRMCCLFALHGLETNADNFLEVCFVCLPCVSVLLFIEVCFVSLVCLCLCYYLYQSICLSF